MRKQLFYIILVLATAACDRDKIGPQQRNPAEEPALHGRKILVINEGNFQRGNASISAYDPDSMHVEHRVFSRFNDERPLGDVAQDLQQHDGKYFVSLNNSAYIQVIDTTTWQDAGRIEGMRAPRYLALAEDRVFATDLFASSLWVADMRSHSIEKRIKLDFPASHLKHWQDRIAVVMQQRLLMIDPVQLVIDTTLQREGNLGSLHEDAAGSLWTWEEKSGQNQLLKISPELNSIESWPLDEAPEKMTLSRSSGLLYLVWQDGVYSHSLGSSTASMKKIIDLDEETIYGMGIDEKREEIYLADALDFDQPAAIYRYDRDGQLLHQFKAGMISNGFYFPR